MSTEAPSVSPPLDPQNDPVRPVSRRTRIALILAALLILAVGVIIWSRGSTGTLIGQDPSLATSPTPLPTPTPEPGVTILLMGRGGAGHDGGALTDTMMVARILEAQQRIVLISIPRDLWVHIPYDGAEGIKGKINSAYAIGIDTKNYPGKIERYAAPSGGGTLASEVVQSVTGMTIDHTFTLDFSGFEKAIDAIGGIELTVERAFTDFEYPIRGRESVVCALSPSAEGVIPPVPSEPVALPTSGIISLEDEIRAGKLVQETLPKLPREYPCRYEALRFEAGRQHMDGATALKYVRSRHSSVEAGDFSRSRRQRLVIQAVGERLFSLNAISKIPTFFATLRSHFDTDLGVTTLTPLLTRAAAYRSYPITNLTLSTDNYLTQGYTADGQFALTPITGESDYRAIKDWIQTSLDPSHALQYPTIEVIGNWKQASAAATLTANLLQAGFPAKSGQLVMKNATSSATLISSNPRIDTTVLHTIATLAGVIPDFITAASPSAKSPARTDITILLP